MGRVWLSPNASRAVIHEELSRKIISAAIAVHDELGPGMLERVYERCLARELELRGHGVQSQVPVPVVYKGLRVDGGYTLDLLVDDTAVIELKAVAQLLPVHEAQLLTYLRHGDYPLGLLFNFNQTLLMHDFRRLANTLPPR